MRTLTFLAVTLLAIGSRPACASDPKVVQHLQAISCTISAEAGFGTAQGSGVIKTRVRGGEIINFVWTAGHVVEGLRKTKVIVDKSGVSRTLVEFNDAKIIKTLVEDGRSVGKLEIFAQVIRYSQEQDLAVLRVRQKNFLRDGVDFCLDPKAPAIGTDLLHVGSLLGEMGSNSLTKGTLSQQGRLVDQQVFDQTTCAAFPGSSGGGVYLEDGRLIGQVLRGAGETFNLIAPARRIVEWARSASIAWAVDDAVPVPPDAELKSLPVEDAGTLGQTAPKAAGHSLKKLTACGCGEKCPCNPCGCGD